MRSAALVLLALGSACVELSAPPCTSAGRCLAGFECVSGQCLECVPGGCGGYQVLAVGPGGGVVCSDDQACVTIPAGALFDSAAIWVRRAAVQSTVSVEARSAIYEFGPSDAVFSMNVQIALPISPSASPERIRVYRLSPDGATPLMGSSEPAKATGASIGLGLFVAGREP